MKVVIAFAFLIGSFAFAENRKPAQYPPFGSTSTTAPTPNFGTPGTTPSPFGTSAPAAGAATTFVTEELVAANSARIYSVNCIFGSSSAYSISINASDARIVRVSAGGPITYEVYRAQKFVASCPAIQVTGPN